MGLDKSLFQDHTGKLGWWLALYPQYKCYEFHSLLIKMMAKEEKLIKGYFLLSYFYGTKGYLAIQYIIFIYSMKKGIKKFLNFSNMLADEARLISLKYFKKKLKIKNKEKSGFDPVTVADIKIQKRLNR